MNAFHLMQQPGSSVIRAFGGLHKLCAWDLPIVTDSGGFQVYSLISQNPKYGSISRQGAHFTTDAGRKLNLTPEKSIQLQMSYGADVLICLDYCTHADEPLSVQREAVARTIDWAKRCKTEFEAGLARRHTSGQQRPMLFAVIQGGSYRDLRKECAEELMKMGFDGFAFGGWPLDSDGNLLTEVLAYTRELVPESYPMHALGVGQPANIVECVRIGYNLFDSVMPTRDARHGRLYSFEADPASPSHELKGQWYSYVYIQDKKHIRDESPVSEYCDCPCCSNYSLAYLHHLFAIGDGLFARLATIHNLRFMTQLMERLGVYEARPNPGG